MAGGACTRALHGDGFSEADGQKLRLLDGDSSISARITWRSSVAEITGKSTTRAQPRASRHWIEENRLGARLEDRHSHQAGKARISHVRLRSSSIRKT